MELAWGRRQYVKGFNLKTQREARRRLRALGKRTRMNRWQNIKSTRAACCNTLSALWAQSVSMHFIRFSVHTYCSYFPEKHRLVFIMETGFVHGTVRIKFLYTIWKSFSQTSLWEICGGQTSRGKVFSSSVSVFGTRWRSWLRHCATSRKVAGSIPDGVLDIVPAALWPCARLSS
jgi:hypothetical protein